jgi:hypothetical protein
MYSTDGTFFVIFFTASRFGTLFAYRVLKTVKRQNRNTYYYAKRQHRGYD